MQLRNVQIKYFRGISSLSIDLDETTVLFGGNNTGKSSILAAIQNCLSRFSNKKNGMFAEYDYYLKDKDSQPTDSAPIEIILTFSEQVADEWPDEIDQILDKAVTLGENDLRTVILRVTSAYDEVTRTFATKIEFLNPKQQPLNVKNAEIIRNLQNLVPMFYLAALRDAAREFRAGSAFWGPFLRAFKIDPALRQQLEADLVALNQQVLNAHNAFDVVKDSLGKTASVVPLGLMDDVVSIEAISGKLFDILSKTQIRLSGKTGAQFPLNQHGEGTQSVAVIGLFHAFLESQLANEYRKESTPILALEEPEAHLHPSAIRAVAGMLGNLRGQKIISTHSGDLLAAVPLTALRRLSRVDGVLTVHRIIPGSIDPKDLRRLDHHVRRHRGNFLFARVWLLVEGETDEFIFQEAARILGHDIFSAGVCCFKFTELSVAHFIKLADQLGIDWIVVSDSDQEGEKYANEAKRLLNARDESKFIKRIPQGDMETFLCNEGYVEVFEQNISEQKRALTPITAQAGSLEYFKQVIKLQPNRGKPERAAQVIEQIENAGAERVPVFLKNVIETAIQRSKDLD